MATLLTGVGYIGAALLRHLAGRADAAPIVALDNFFTTPRDDVRAALATDVELVEGDVAEAEDVARAFQALHTAAPGRARTTVYHLAAQPSAAIAASDPSLTERSNLRGARILLEAAREHAAQVVFGGSFRVYGDELVGQTVSESTPYGRVGDLSHLSKVYVEQLARMLGVPFISVRLGVTYGRSPIMKTVPSLMTVPNLFCKRAVEGEVLSVLQDRPLAFIHVDDAAEALVCAAHRLARLAASDSCVFEVVNAAPEVATLGQLARTTQQVANGRGADVRISGATTSEAGFTVTSTLEAEDHFTPRRRLRDGLIDVYDYFATSST